MIWSYARTSMYVCDICGAVLTSIRNDGEYIWNHAYVRKELVLSNWYKNSLD